jgi:UDP-4-amino-4,6-dideoxy-N-acetyl-beta-L-altrosamine N-acetyltransferase
MKMPTLGGAVMRNMVHADLERVLAWRNHTEIRRYMYTQHEINLDEHCAWFERARLDPRKNLLIYEAESRALGFVSFSEVGSCGVADWGFYAAPDAPKGSGRQFGRAALDHAFNVIHLHKVCGQALAFNERSIRFHQSLGFQQEGELRDQHFDGEIYHHVKCFGLLSHEWLSRS